MANPPDRTTRKVLEAGPQATFHHRSSLLIRLTPSQRFGPTPPTPPKPVMTHQQFEHSSFTLHSKLIYLTHQKKRLVVHVHKTTGEVSLPRGPCRVLPLWGRSGSNIGIESFHATALRMASQELGCQTVARGYIVRTMVQSEEMDDADGMWLMPPFLIDWGSEPVRGIAKVAAWFLAFMVGDCCEEEWDLPLRGTGRELEEGELEEGELWEGNIEGRELGGGESESGDARVRGPDWVVKYMTLTRAAQRLPEHEAEITRKAVAFVKIHIEA